MEALTAPAATAPDPAPDPAPTPNSPSHGGSSGSSGSLPSDIGADGSIACRRDQLPVQQLQVQERHHRPGQRQLLRRRQVTGLQRQRPGRQSGGFKPLQECARPHQARLLAAPALAHSRKFRPLDPQTQIRRHLQGHRPKVLRVPRRQYGMGALPEQGFRRAVAGDRL